MTDWLFPTAFSSWRPGDGSAEAAAIDRVLRSNRLTAGPEVEAFEDDFAAYHNRRHGIMVNSGSSANLVAVSALCAKHGVGAPKDLDKTVTATVPAIAWATTYAPLRQNGFDLLISDVDESWNSPSCLSEMWKAELHVVCSILGNPIEFMPHHAQERGCRIFEDNCESLGARDESGRLCGTFGDVSTFSFYYSHQISAIEGGMVLTDDDELAVLCRRLANHGWTKNDREYAPVWFEGEYDFRLFGYNLRGLELHAAVAREQLRHLDQMIQARRANLAHFVAETHGLPIKHQQTRGQPSPFGLPFTLEDSARRTSLVVALRAAGIDCRLPTGGSFLRHAYSEPWRDQKTPNADYIHRSGLFLGNAPFPILDLIDRAVAVMREVL